VEWSGLVCYHAVDKIGSSNRAFATQVFDQIPPASDY
jgi:hypothetical protein